MATPLGATREPQPAVQPLLQQATATAPRMSKAWRVYAEWNYQLGHKAIGRSQTSMLSAADLVRLETLAAPLVSTAAPEELVHRVQEAVTLFGGEDPGEVLPARTSRTLAFVHLRNPN